MFVSTVARRVAAPARRSLSTTPLRQADKAFITYAKHLEQHSDGTRQQNARRFSKGVLDVPGGAYPSSM